MVLRMIELGYPLDEVLHCDTTIEFPAMYRHIERVKTVVEAAGVKFTTLRAEHDFEYYLLHHKPKRRNPEMNNLSGQSWPTAQVRWCTGQMKIQVTEKYFRKLRQEYNITQYIGIAADEGYRLDRKNNQASNHLHPLVEWKWSEDDALNYCRAKGYDWEGLYDIFPRVSCWCCPLKPLEDFRKIRKQFPELWSKLQVWDKKTWSKFKGDYTVQDLDRRFELEETLTVEGEKIKDRKFFADLRRCLQDGASIEEIITDRQVAKRKREDYD